MPDRVVLLGGDPRKKLNGFINLRGKVYADALARGFDEQLKLIPKETIAQLIERRVTDGQVLTPQMVSYWTDWWESVEPILASTAASGARSVTDSRVAIVKQQRPYPAREGALQWLDLHRDFLIGHFGRQSGKSLEAILRNAAANDQYGAGTVARDLQGVIRLRPAQAERISRLYFVDRENLGAREARKRAKAREAEALKDRIRVVAQHETAQMWNRGALEAVKEAVEAGTMDPNTTKVWLTVGDDRVCPICGPLHHQELELDEPFESIRGFKDQSPPAHISCRCALAFKRSVQEEEEQDDDAVEEPFPNYMLLGGALAGAVVGAMAARAARQVLSQQFEWVDHLQGVLSLTVEHEVGTSQIVAQQRQAAVARQVFEEQLAEAWDRALVADAARDVVPVAADTVRLGEIYGVPDFKELFVSEVFPGGDLLIDADKMPQSVAVMSRFMRSRVMDEEAGAALYSGKLTTMLRLWFGVDTADQTWGSYLLRWASEPSDEVLQEAKAFLGDTVTVGQVRTFLNTFADPDLQKQTVGATDMYPRFMAAEGFPVENPIIAPLEAGAPNVFRILSYDEGLLRQLVAGRGGFAQMPYASPGTGYTLFYDDLDGVAAQFKRANTPVYELRVRARPGARGIGRTELAEIQEKIKEFSSQDMYRAALNSVLPKVKHPAHTGVRKRFEARLGEPFVSPADERFMPTMGKAVTDTIAAGEMTVEEAHEVARKIGLVHGRALAFQRLYMDDATMARLLGYDFIRGDTAEDVALGRIRHIMVNPGAYTIDSDMVKHTPAQFKVLTQSAHNPVPMNPAVPSEVLTFKQLHKFNTSANPTFVLEDPDGVKWFAKSAAALSTNAGVRNEIKFSDAMAQMGLSYINQPIGPTFLGPLVNKPDAVIARLAPAHTLLRPYKWGPLSWSQLQLSDEGLVDALRLRMVDNVLGADDRHTGQYGHTNDGRFLGFDYESVSFTNWGGAHENAIDEFLPFSDMAGWEPKRILDVLEDQRDRLFALESRTASGSPFPMLKSDQIRHTDDVVKVWSTIVEIEEILGSGFNDAAVRFGFKTSGIPTTKVFQKMWRRTDEILAELEKTKALALARGEIPDVQIPAFEVDADIALDPLALALRAFNPDEIQRDYAQILVDKVTEAAEAASFGDLAAMPDFDVDFMDRVTAWASSHIAQGRMDAGLARENLEALADAISVGDTVQSLQVLSRDWGVDALRVVEELAAQLDPTFPQPVARLEKMVPAVRRGGFIYEALGFKEYALLNGSGSRDGFRSIVARAVKDDWYGEDSFFQFLDPKVQIAQAQAALLGLRAKGVFIEDEWDAVRRIARNAKTQEQRLRAQVFGTAISEEPREGFVRFYRGVNPDRLKIRGQEGGTIEGVGGLGATEGRWFTTSYDEAVNYANWDFETTGELGPSRAVLAVDVPEDEAIAFAEVGNRVAIDVDDVLQGMQDVEALVDGETAARSFFYEGDRAIAALDAPHLRPPEELALEARRVVGDLVAAEWADHGSIDLRDALDSAEGDGVLRKLGRALHGTDAFNALRNDGDLPLPEMQLFPSTAYPIDGLEIAPVADVLQQAMPQKWEAREKLFEWVASHRAMKFAEFDPGRVRSFVRAVEDMNYEDTDSVVAALVKAERVVLDVPRGQLAQGPEGMAALRYLLSDTQQDPDVMLARVWFNELPAREQIAIRLEGNLLGGDLELYDQQWLVRQVVKSNAENPNATPIESYAPAVGLRMLLASEAPSERVRIYEGIRDAESLVAYALSQGYSPAELAVHYAGQSGSISQKVNMLLGGLDVEGRRIPAGLNDMGMKRILTGRMVPHPMGTFAEGVQMGVISPIDANRVLAAFNRNKQLSELVPMVNRILKDPDARSRVTGEVWEALVDVASAAEAGPAALSEPMVKAAKRSVFEMSILEHRPDIGGKVRREVAGLAVEYGLKAGDASGRGFDQVIRNRDFSSKGLMRLMENAGFLEPGRHAIPEAQGKLKLPAVVERILAETEGRGVDPWDIYNEVRDIDLTDFAEENTVWDAIGVAIVRDEALEFLRGRYGVGQLGTNGVRSRVDDSNQFRTLYRHLDLMNSHGEVAVAKAWADLSIATFRTAEERTLARSILTAANRAGTGHDKKSWVARYIALKNRGQEPSMVEVASEIKNGDIYETMARFVSYAEHATRRELPPARINEVLDALESGDAGDILSQIKRLRSAAELAMRMPGQGLAGPHLLEELSEWNRRVGAVFPEPDKLSDMLPAAGPLPSVRRPTDLEDALEAAIKASALVNDDRAIIALSPAPHSGTGVMSFERAFYREWRMILTRERRHIPEFTEADAGQWSVDEVKEMAGRVQKMLDEVPPAAQVASFEKLVDEGRTEEWVSMLNYWIDDANHLVAREVLDGPLGQVLPGGEAWHIAGLGTDPRVRNVIQLFVSSEESAGRISTDLAQQLAGRLQTATDGSVMIQVWLDAHKAARVSWPDVSQEQVAWAASRNRVRDMAQRVIMLHDQAFGSRVDESRRTLLNEALDSRDYFTVRRILNELITEVNQSIGLAA